MIRLHLVVLMLSIIAFPLLAQKIPKTSLDNPIITDSASTIMFLEHYDNIFSSGKFGAAICSNIIFYNFKTDTSKKLFNNLTYIDWTSISNSRYMLDDQTIDKDTKNILYLVRNFDFNKNGKIDDADPSMLYASDLYGNNLISLTPEDEDVIKVQVFIKQKIALVKIRKIASPGKTNAPDYYIKLDLNTLKFGNKIEGLN